MKPVPTALALLGAAAFPLAHGSASATVIIRLAITGATLGATAVTDMTEHRIPNRVVLPAAAACAALVAIAGISAAAAIGLVVVLLLLILSLASPSALGMGDIKLMLVIVLGINQSAIRALMLGLLLAGAGAATVLSIHGRAAGRRALPLAPFLALGSLLAVL